MPLILTRDDIDTHLGGPTPAEEHLLEAVQAGEVCVLGDRKLPPGDAGPDRTIRADVLRYLILGGCEACQVQGWGVRLYGARVTGALDLSFQTARGATGLIACRFTDGVEAMQTRLTALNLNNSHLPALNAQGAEVKGSVFLGGVTTTGEVRLPDAIIGGQLACVGATLSNAGGHALTAQGAEVKGDVFLPGVTTTGEVSLSGAAIGGQLSCVGATLSNAGGPALNAEGAEVKGGIFLPGVTATGEVRLSGAVIGGQLSCVGATLSNAEGFALNVQSAEVKGGLFWRDGARCLAGSMAFAGAHVTGWADDLTCWPTDGRLLLDGLTYDRIHGDLDVDARLRWLASGSYFDGAFTPQPYTQLARVYRAMGRDGDARRVLYEREKREHVDLRRRLLAKPAGTWWDWPRFLWRRVWHPACVLWDWTLRVVVGHGYRPHRALYCLIALWLLATFLAHQAWETGTFAPNSGPVQISEAWQAMIACPQTCPDNPAQVWSETTQAGQDWETFNRYAYAADLVIPIIDLNQTDAWAPSPNRGVWGKWVWVASFFLNLLGWIITALGAAALTGIIQKERE
ncbi:hypothetical protein [Jannaschia sp. M317]|uniref:hypothetical protein n=1 Tax=Jannaschia sp. M317 TaxID=2867011 RepID=UPI0021A8165B|nr:hypothetical protein [Jannaschia sp. M317]UWQ18840.1 hypothetical protein K3551_06020 [Jannaschia sp. M317]